MDALYSPRDYPTFVKFPITLIKVVVLEPYLLVFICTEMFRSVQIMQGYILL